MFVWTTVLLIHTFEMKDIIILLNIEWKVYLAD